MKAGSMRRTLPFLPLVLPALLAAAGWLAPATARADGPGPAPLPHTYAVVVGSNEGGAGQQPLHFAEEDAQRMARVLREIGHFDAADVRVLMHPTPAGVVGALDDVATK